MAETSSDVTGYQYSDRSIRTGVYHSHIRDGRSFTVTRMNLDGRAWHLSAKTYYPQRFEKAGLATGLLGFKSCLQADVRSV